MHERHDLLTEMYQVPWAILPGHLAGMLASVASGATSAASPPVRAAARVGKIAVIPIMGPISQRLGMVSLFFGGTAIEGLRATLGQALADPDVAAIILDVDSPGGTVSGVPELANDIHGARGIKPIVAVANTLAASAAYWLASSADELIVSPSGEVGSIGVFALHENLKGMLTQRGVEITPIVAGKYKLEGNPFEPLGETARQAIQDRVNEYYEMFVATVARNRGVTPSDVRNGFGEGRVVGPKQAVATGMADRIATMDETIARLAASVRQGSSTPATPARTSAGLVQAGPIPPHRSPGIADEDEPWDGPGEVARAEGAEALRRMHAWVDSNGDPDAKSSYKLPHHRAADGYLVPRGLFAAAAALQGGRGGVDIPAADVPGVKRHLEEHYRELDRTAPWTQARGDDVRRRRLRYEERLLDSPLGVW